ncbi:hypothetical protein B0H15DRAFT_896981 [Mycena belliarum]|uniref:SnoaL-like domain-containing protein n=1 Tax=Mycena belliarum TaxID=1033014 RepID=A0AAD6UNN9_9AGAR|nr:hypothetical protein B0H15DRAFT_896981 [Mycena belliae]
MTPYPSQLEIREIFAPLSVGNTAGFFAHVAGDVEWTVMGHNPFGEYSSKEELMRSALQRLGAIMKEPLTLTIDNVVGGGQEARAVVEIELHGVCKNGLDFDVRYAFSVKFNVDRKIVEVREYRDSALVNRALGENE